MNVLLIGAGLPRPFQLFSGGDILSVRSSIVSCVAVFLAVVLVFLCFARPLPLNAAATETIAFFAIFATVLAAMGIKFSVSGGTQALQDSMSSAWSGFKALNPLSPIIDIIEQSFSRAFSSSGSYVSMSPAEFSAYQELADYYISENNISSGSFSNPISTPIVPSVYVPFSFSPDVDTLRPVPAFSVTDSDIYAWVYVTDTQWPTRFFQLPKLSSAYLIDIPTDYAFPHLHSSGVSFSGSFSVYSNGATISIPVRYNASTYLYGIGYARSQICSPYSISWRLGLDYSRPAFADPMPYANVSTPPKMIFLKYGNSAFVGLYYSTVDGRWVASAMPSAGYSPSFVYLSNSDSVDASSYGSSFYSFPDDGGKVYIDTGISGLSGYNDILSAIQQNLLDITTALQELNSGNLPVDVTPISTLISDFEALTNAVYAGTSTLSACLSAMYQELISALSGVNNLPYAQTLIDIYHSFVDKLALYNSGSASSISGDISSVKSLQSALSGLRDDVADGTLSADEAIDSAYQAYTESLDGARDAAEASALLQSYQSFVDSLAVSSYASAVSATATDLSDYLALDDGLMDLFDVSRLEAWMDYEHYNFLPSSEANLYREYFNDLADVESPTYNYIFVPLSLLLTMLLLGTSISYVKSKSKK